MFKFPQQNATKYASVFQLYNIPILGKHKLREVVELKLNLNNLLNFSLFIMSLPTGTEFKEFELDR